MPILKESWLTDENIHMSQETTREQPRDVCEVNGCRDDHSRFWVAKVDDVLRVCRRCAQEMTAVHGWTLAGVVDEVALNQPA